MHSLNTLLRVRAQATGDKLGTGGDRYERGFHDNLDGGLQAALANEETDRAIMHFAQADPPSEKPISQLLCGTGPCRSRATWHQGLGSSPRCTRNEDRVEKSRRGAQRNLGRPADEICQIEADRLSKGLYRCVVPLTIQYFGGDFIWITAVRWPRTRIPLQGKGVIRIRTAIDHRRNELIRARIVTHADEGIGARRGAESQRHTAEEQQPPREISKIPAVTVCYPNHDEHSTLTSCDFNYQVARAPCARVQWRVSVE